MSNQKKNTSRRGFLKKLWIALGIVAGLEITYLIFSFLNPKKKLEKPAASIFEAGPVENFPKGSISSFRSRSFFLSRQKSGEFMALSFKCTHLGCVLELDEERNLLVCPCHSSMFNARGDVLRAPATRDLDRLEVSIENGIVMVNTSKITNRKRGLAQA